MYIHNGTAMGIPTIHEQANELEWYGMIVEWLRREANSMHFCFLPPNAKVRTE